MVNFVLCILCCIWNTHTICIFGDIGVGHVHDVEGWQNMFVLNWRSEHFYYLPCVYLHMIMIWYINYFELQAYLVHGNVKVNSFDGWQHVLCIIIAHPSNSTLTVFLDPPKSLLLTNYLKNMICTLFLDWRCLY